MKILILGATGRVGCRIVAHALQDGNEVVALVRQPDKMTASGENLTVLQGNVIHLEDISTAMQGADVVVSALGTDGTTTLTESMPMIIDEMNKRGIRRIVTVGTAGILQSRTNPELLRYQSPESRRKTTFAAEEHQRVHELLKRSALDWTIVCPTFLPDGDPIGEYRVERDYLPEGGASISVGDTAEFTYRLIVSDEYLRTRVGIAY